MAQDFLATDFAAFMAQTARPLAAAMAGLDAAQKGGPGSGFYGHAGRPGQVGGSAAGNGKPAATKQPWQMKRDEYALQGVSESQDRAAGGLYDPKTRTVHYAPGGGTVNDFVRQHEIGHHLFSDLQNISVVSMLQDRPDVMAEIADTSSGRSHFGRNKLEHWDDNPENPRNYDWIETLADLWAEHKFGRLSDYPHIGPWLESIAPAYQAHRAAVQRALAAGHVVPAAVLQDYPDLARAQKGGPGSGNWGHRGRPGKVGGSSAGDRQPAGTPTAPRLADTYQPPKTVTNLRGAPIPPPRAFYRGSNPGDTRRIVTGAATWDSYLFVADSARDAQNYGARVVRVVAKPAAKILYEGTATYRHLARGIPTSGSLRDLVAAVAERAQAEGFDAVWFKRQGDVGTAIFNPAAFEIGA